MPTSPDARPASVGKRPWRQHAEDSCPTSTTYRAPIGSTITCPPSVQIMRWRRRSAPGLSTPGRLFVFARHAESEANIANALSSDPARPVALTEHGRQQARELGAQLTNLGVDLAVATRFLRTQQTIEIALRGRQVPIMIEPGFDEVDAGDFDGAPIDTYWSWKHGHSSHESFPGGESEDDALGRYADALQRLLW